MLDTSWFTLNDHGIWCNFCNEYLVASWEIEDGQYDEPEGCKTCGAPDEFDPEAAGFA